MCFSPNPEEMSFQWEIYYSDDEEEGPETAPPPSPRSASPTPSQAPSEAPSEASSKASQDSSKGGAHSIGSRIQAVTLLEIGMPHE
jgi:hypothetical protein